MAQIDKPNLYFNTKLYTGNGSTQSITGVGFKPDWIWGKNRDGANSHWVNDVIRGVDIRLIPNETGAEDTPGTAIVTSFDSDGFSLGSNTEGNANANDYVSWNWKANGTGSSNTDGSITSTVSANTTSGFSIVSYTGNGTAGATIGHSLGVKPSMIIVKSRDSAQHWRVYHSSLGATKMIRLSSNGAEVTSSVEWNNTEPTSSLFTVGSDGSVNASGDTYIAYCFAEKKGFSKFGSYVGNGSTDGSFIYTGFKPAFTIIKRSTDGTESWILQDNKRSPANPSDVFLAPNSSDADNTTTNAHIDYLSNGFKLRHSDTRGNTSGITYIYMAFAENPLVGTNNIPATAR